MQRNEIEGNRFTFHFRFLAKLIKITVSVKINSSIFSFINNIKLT